MNQEGMKQEPKIQVTRILEGYASRMIEGTYEGNVTEADLKARFFHPHFGGRNVYMREGKFSLISHED